MAQSVTWDKSGQHSDLCSARCAMAVADGAGGVVAPPRSPPPGPPAAARTPVVLPCLEQPPRVRLRCRGLYLACRGRRGGVAARRRHTADAEFLYLRAPEADDGGDADGGTRAVPAVVQFV